jgi:hypothetical protein
MPSACPTEPGVASGSGRHIPQDGSRARFGAQVKTVERPACGRASHLSARHCPLTASRSKTAIISPLLSVYRTARWSLLRAGWVTRPAGLR